MTVPDDDADEEPLTLNTQTFDSDAALLDISTIQEISVSKATEATEAKAERLKEKVETGQ